MQVNELGVLETPIALTNTLSVGTVVTAQMRAAIAAHPGSRARRRRSTRWCSNATTATCPTCRRWPSPRRITHRRSPRHRPTSRGERWAPVAACPASGSRAASARRRGSRRSRRIDYALGALVLANFGKLETLTLAGRRIGPVARAQARAPRRRRTSGSIIVVLATDAPLDHRQLRRVAMRAAAGIGRTGSFYGHGSGDIALAFSTAQTVAHEGPALADVRRARRAAARPAVRSRRRSDRAGDRRRALRRGDRHRIRAVTCATRSSMSRRIGRRSKRDAADRRALPRRLRAGGGDRSARVAAAAARPIVDLDAPSGRGFVVATPRRSTRSAGRALCARRHRSSSARCSSARARTRCSTPGPRRVARIGSRRSLALIESFRAAFALPGAPHAARGRLAFGSIRLETPDTNDGKELSGICRAIETPLADAMRDRGSLVTGGSESACAARPVHRRRKCLSRREPRPLGQPVADGHPAPADAGRRAVALDA